MSTLSELVVAHSTLDAADVEWLHRLVRDWQIVADLSFADLVLWVQTRDGDRICVAQMRPTTGPTVYPQDLVGTRVGPGERFLVERAAREGRIVRDGEPEWRAGEVPVRHEAVPVRHRDRVVAVVGRETNLSAARVPSQLELVYLQTADDLAEMIAAGRFPLPDQPDEAQAGPRAGDGLLRLDPSGAVTYASPNALSAYRRLGITGDLRGADLAAVTRDLVGTEPATRIAAALGGRAPGLVEVEAAGAVVLLRALPLRPGGPSRGALVLVRDVTEVRRRDEQLLSKDATIREIHHRVKNNLQTVAALLRLQARRVPGDEAKAALEESVRRVSVIAEVHETLSLSLDEHVDFDGVVDRVVAMVVDVAARSADVRVRRQGSFGVLPAAVATPLVMVVSELVQNAVEHAFSGDRAGTVVVRPSRRDGRLRVTVSDDGRGLPPGFTLEAATGLGLQIARTLVTAELRGTLRLGARRGGGTQAAVEVPVAPQP